MAYKVHITDADRDYLNNLPLSEGAKQKVEDLIEYGIAQLPAARNILHAVKTGSSSKVWKLSAKSVFICSLWLVWRLARQPSIAAVKSS
jgi:hypothetical protein